MSIAKAPSADFSASRRRVLKLTAAAAVGIASAPTMAAPITSPIRKLDPNSPDPVDWTMRKAAAMLGDGQISSIELTEAILARIQRINPDYNAFLTVTGDVALVSARQADANFAKGIRLSAMQGIPFGLKDNIDTGGIRTTVGMKQFFDRVPDTDATVAARLKSGGAVLVGKNHLAEAATTVHHPIYGRAPKSPWRDGMWTGTSSSGSGVAVATGMCFGSLGTDTGGSIRLPAMSNGITGLKPTWERVSAAGIFPLVRMSDAVGPLTRDAWGAAAMMSVIAGEDDRDMITSIRPVPDYLASLEAPLDAGNIRIGIDREFNTANVTPDVLASMSHVEEVLRELGFTIVEFKMPDVSRFEFGKSKPTAHVAYSHRDIYPEQAADYTEGFAKGLEAGRNADPLDMAAAELRRAGFKGEMARTMRELDLILSPVAPRPTPNWNDVMSMMGSGTYGKFLPYLGYVNVAGLPSIAFPAGFSSEGTPLSAQLIGRPFGEDLLLNSVDAFQQVTDWHLHTAVI
ncbi:amidase [Croceicoccus mobilis]|nr:amidase [Croceicoccus mobilis]